MPNACQQRFRPDQPLTREWRCWRQEACAHIRYLQAIIDGIHARGQRFVPIVEPVVHIQPGYSVYDTGKAEGVFVNDVTGNPYVGQVSSALEFRYQGLGLGVWALTCTLC